MMIQKRLNDAMMLSIHKESTDKLALTDIANMVCEIKIAKDFGVFSKEDCKKLPIALPSTLSNIFYTRRF